MSVFRYDWPTEPFVLEVGSVVPVSGVEVAGNAVKEGVERFTVIGQIGRVAGAGQLPLILADAVLAVADVFLARSAVIVVLPCGTLGRVCRRS